MVSFRGSRKTIKGLYQSKTCRLTISCNLTYLSTVITPVATAAQWVNLIDNTAYSSQNMVPSGQPTQPAKAAEGREAETKLTNILFVDDATHVENLAAHAATSYA